MIKEGINQTVVAQEISGMWEDWTLARRLKERRWLECVKNYLVEIDEAKYDGFPWRSKVADTLSQETADSIASNLLNGLFPLDEKFFELLGQDDKGLEFAGPMQAYVERGLAAAKLIESARPWVKQLAVIGNSPWIGSYRPVKPCTRHRVRTVHAGSGKQTIAVQDTDSAHYEECVFETLDAFDVVFNPATLDLAESPIIRRMKLSRTAVTRLKWAKNLNLLKDHASGAPSEESDSFKRQRELAFGISDNPESTDEHDPDQIELLFAYGDLEIEGELHRDMIAVVADREIVLRFERQPFWAGRPIGWAGYDRMWNTAYEKGPLEPLCGTQSLIDTFQNQKADVLNLIINGCFAYVNDGIIDPDALWLRPGGFIEVGDIKNLQALQPSNNVALTYQELEMLRARAERSSGASRFDMGQAPGGRRTAYEANLIRSGGSSRANDVLRHLANGPMEQYVQWVVGTTQQMKWRPRSYLMPGLPNEALLGRYRANFTGADLTVMQQYMIQNIMMAFQVLSQSPEFSAAVKKDKLLKKLFRALKLDDPDIYNTPEEQNAEMEKMMAMQGKGPAAQVGQSGSGPGGQDAGLEALLGAA
jgi:hypothetical protein